MRSLRLASLRSVAVLLALAGAASAEAQDGDAMRAAAGPGAWTLEGRELHGAALRPPSAGSPEATARAVLRAHGAALGVPDASALVLARQTEAHGYVVVELAHVVRGRPVERAPIIVRLRPDGAVDEVRVTPLPARIEEAPAEDRAADATRAALALIDDDRAQVAGSTRVELATDDAVVPAYAVELEIGRARVVRVLVDAATGLVVDAEERALEALGRVYPHNPVSDDMAPSDLPLTDLTSATTLTGTYLDVQSCDQLSPDCNTVQRATADVNGDFLYNPDSHAFDDAFAEVSAYFHGSQAIDYFRTQHGFTWGCGGSSQMLVVVNYTETPHIALENAMFVPGSRSRCGYLAFGQGVNSDFAYDGDVVTHEFGHAVTDAIADLGYFSNGPSPSYQPLAINEGTSDYWAATLQGDPQVAESLPSLEGFGGGGALRSLANDLTCPQDLFGEGHYDGRIWSALGWAMRGILGAERADRIWYVTMATLSGGVTLAQATETVLSTVASEVTAGRVTAEEQAMIVEQAVTRGLRDCAMFIPAETELGYAGYAGSAFVTGQAAHGLAPLQYTIELPPDVTDVTVDVSHPTLTGTSTIHFNTNAPVRATSARVTSVHRDVIGRAGTARYTLADGLTPCSTLYVGVETTDLRAGESLYALVFHVYRSNHTIACPVPGADAGTDSGAPDAGAPADGAIEADASPVPPATSSSCGCRAATRPTGALPLGLGLVLALVGLRRRAR